MLSSGCVSNTTSKEQSTDEDVNRNRVRRFLDAHDKLDPIGKRYTCMFVNNLLMQYANNIPEVKKDSSLFEEHESFVGPALDKATEKEKISSNIVDDKVSSLINDFKDISIIEQTTSTQPTEIFSKPLPRPFETQPIEENHLELQPTLNFSYRPKKRIFDWNEKSKALRTQYKNPPSNKPIHFPKSSTPVNRNRPC